MSMYGKNHYNIVISLQLIKINEKKKKAGTYMMKGLRRKKRRLSKMTGCRGCPTLGVKLVR